jgi:hypothetical protein
MIFTIIILSVICVSLMATFVVVIKEINKNDNYKLEKFLWTVSYLSWAWTEPESSEDEIIPLDEVSPEELIWALNEEYEDN